MIKFDLAPVAETDNGARGTTRDHSRPEQPLDASWSNQLLSQLPDSLKYDRFGGIPPFVRASIPRVALGNLAATGVLAALVAVSASDKEAAFSCALAAAVNFVACAHYHYIVKVRSQELPPSLLQFASGRDLEGKWTGRQDNENEYDKMFAQEIAVDSLRHSDWMVTLVLLVLDLYRLAEHATGRAQSWLSAYTAAALVPVMVLLGALYRFAATELNGKDSIDRTQATVGILGFVGSCVVLGIVMSGILQPIDAQLCMPGAASGSNCPITDPKLKRDADAVRVLTWTWVGYPVVSVLSRSAMPRGTATPKENTERYAWVSLFKDLSYAVLDVVAKGGLAIYVCYRTTRA